MMKRDLLEFLEDIAESIAEIESFVVGLDLESFAQKREKVLAVVKLLEIIGEATKKIPNEIREQYPEIPWKSVAGMRDIFVHEYWRIDIDVVWMTVRESLPQLKPIIDDLITTQNKT